MRSVRKNQIITLATVRGEDRYRVVSTSVVNPVDTSVLKPTGRSTLTLVTCYPFYFIGPGARHAPPLRGQIEFEEVSFGYTADRPVLKGISLTAEAGHMTALVGPTGSGKTTIAALIGRFYDPDSGKVTIDGVDVRKFQQKSLHDQMSFVLQENILFHATIAQNIAFGKLDATEDEIRRAAELANAHEFIKGLPQGYDTMVGERDVTLSGGQRQRIAIARAIIRNTPILIMDEPSSGLDATSEELVFEAIDRLIQGRTTIVIAHRFSTIRHAHSIFAVENGRIVESGTHDQLLAAGGLYARLFELQFSKDIECRKGSSEHALAGGVS